MLIMISYAQNRACSPLLKLPAEIRQMIYEYALGNKCIFVKHTPPFGSQRQEYGIGERTHTVRGGFHCTVYDKQVNPYTVLAFAHNPPEAEEGFTLLSRVCRQLYQETATLPYELNVLAFQSQTVFDRYFIKERRLSLPLRRAIRTLFLREHSVSNTMRKYLGGVQLVRVDFARYVMEYDLQEGSETKLQKSPTELVYERRERIRRLQVLLERHEIASS